MQSSSTPQIVALAEQYVRTVLSGNDASHDFYHIERVVKNAQRIAQREGVTCVHQLEVIHLAALLHDVHDYKYSGSESAGAIAITQFLTEHAYDGEHIRQILYIVNNLSFKNELMAADKNCNEQPPDQWKQALAIVQDADRLDAIGAIGVGRCMAFSGAKGRALYDPEIKPRDQLSKEEYMNKSSSDDTAINHFYEKLFKLKDLMRTKTGREMAESRHRFMQQYVDQFLAEWECRD